MKAELPFCGVFLETFPHIHLIKALLPNENRRFFSVVANPFLTHFTHVYVHTLSLCSQYVHVYSIYSAFTIIGPSYALSVLPTSLVLTCRVRPYLARGICCCRWLTRKFLTLGRWSRVGRSLWPLTDVLRLNIHIKRRLVVFIPLKTKRWLIYLKTQFVPRSKHFISVIKTNQFML